MSGDQVNATQYKEFLLAAPFVGSALAMTWEVGRFVPMDGFFFFSLAEHLIAAFYALPIALLFLIFVAFGLNSARYSKRSAIVEDTFDVVLLSIFVVILIVTAYWAAHSVFFYSLAGCLASLVLFRPAPKGAASFVTLCTGSLLLSFALGVDYTRLELVAAKEITQKILTKSGSFEARVMMMGERGTLLFRPDNESFDFRRPDDILTIAWKQNRKFGVR